MEFRVRDKSEYRRRDFPLVELLRDGFGGVCFALIGLGCLWFGLSKPVTGKTVAGGVVLVVLGAFFFWRALRRWRTMKAIVSR